MVSICLGQSLEMIGVARYHEVADDLRQRIERGEWPPGETIPGEIELMGTYEVSRSTVRNAIAELHRAGMLMPIRHRGTVVRRPPVRVSLSRYANVLQPDGERGPWGTACEAHGIRGRVTMLDVRRIPAGPDVAPLLGLDIDTDVIYRLRHMLADDDVCQIQEAWIPAALVAGTVLAGTEKIKGGTYGAFTAIGHPPATITETVAARIPTSEEVTTMRLAPGVPVLTIERVTLDEAGTALELLRVVSAADRTELVYGGLPLRGHAGTGQ